MTITPIYAAVLALLFVALAVNVVRTRRRAGVSLGDGGDKLLARRIRAHGNFVEYVPMALILMVMIEERGAEAAWVHGLNGALVLGRLMHAFALSSLTLRPFHRTGGLALTLFVIVAAVVQLLRDAIGAALG